jgi:hypothetical protein
MDTVEDTHGDYTALHGGHAVSLRKHTVVAGHATDVMAHSEK